MTPTMDILVKVGQVLLSFSIIVILHEFGHFFFAKLFSVRVEKFYLFFNPWFSLFKFKRDETEYGIGWIPCGGYVKLSGMIDESLDEEQIKQEPKAYEFRSKPAWQRLCIMLGGVFFNLLLAFIIYSGILYTWGNEYLATKNLKYGVSCAPVALELGFQNGDKILTVGGYEVENFWQVSSEIFLNDDREVVVQRGDNVVKINIPEVKVDLLLNNPSIFIPRFPIVVDGVKAGSVAEKAGLQKGDKLIAINNEPKQFFDEYRDALLENTNNTLVMKFSRDNKIISFDLDVAENGDGGVIPSGDMRQFFEISRKEYTIFQSIPAGLKMLAHTMNNYWKQLKLMFAPETKSSVSVGGVISIGNMFSVTWDWYYFWILTAFFSIIVAIFNIFPIPALDGGYVVFLLYEIIFRRKLSDKFIGNAQVIGMIILLGLLLYANVSDVINLFN